MSLLVRNRVNLPLYNYMHLHDISDFVAESRLYLSASFWIDFSGIVEFPRSRLIGDNRYSAILPNSKTVYPTALRMASWTVLHISR